MANFRIEYDVSGFLNNTASAGFDPCSIACAPDNDIPDWEREPSCLHN
jgi:hypothetical protein